MAGVIAGTPLYMAPEQLSGKGLSNRTDLYALALVMRNMLWGEPENVRTFQLVAERVTSTAELLAHPSMPPEFRDLLAAMMRRDPEKRPARARDVASILDRVLETVPHRSVDLAAKPPGRMPAPAPVEGIEATVFSSTGTVLRLDCPTVSGGIVCASDTDPRFLGRR
jgi:serine/threonine-protein kinase